MRGINRSEGTIAHDLARERNRRSLLVLPADKIVPVAHGRLRHKPIVFADGNFISVKRYGIQARLTV